MTRSGRHGWRTEANRDMERVPVGRASRVEPAAVTHAGGERSAKHRFPRGAAGIDKGGAVPPLSRSLHKRLMKLPNAW